jgi:uncharacterized protein (DUF849 family)
VGDGLVLQLSTEAVGRYSSENQMDLVREVRPEAVSLALQELCPSPAREGRALEFFNWLAEEGIWVQYILYRPEQLVRLEDMRRRGVLGSSRPSCLLVLGNYAEQRPGSNSDLQGFLSVPGKDHFDWSACCFGASEQRVMRQVVRAGGQVRLGFENNFTLPNGLPARSNTQLIREFVGSLPKSAPRPATAEEVRSAFMQN